MQDLKLLEKRGATHEHFKALFDSDKPSEKIKRIQEIHSNRLRRAIETNLNEGPIYGMIDRQLEAAQANLPYMQARELASSGKTHEEIIAAFKSFGLDRMLEVAYDATTGASLTDKKRNEPLLTFNQPLFETVLIPLVLAYCDIRIAKLYNDRNQHPRYKYPPARITQEDMAISEIITNRVQQMAEEMGYAEDDKQSIRKMVIYGTCFNFPKETYWRQSYVTEDNGKEVKKTLREGVRFVIPHPRRTFWDRLHPLYTLNSDTGVRYCGYWDIVPYADIRDNDAFWKRDKITFGGYSIFNSTAWRLFSQFYPCVISFPKMWVDAATSDKFDRISGECFPTDEQDASVNIAPLFDKIIPSEWGLFDYDEPVWMRFVYANLDTCIHAEVYPYTPGYVYLDRYDADKTVSPSLALQLSPFQQFLGNFITQHFKSVKENLLRVSFVNTDIVPVEQVKLLQKMKDRLYNGWKFLMYSQKQNQIVDADQRRAIENLNVPQVDVSQLRSNITLVLTVLERMLGFSAQEVGAPASHEQSAREITVVANNTSVNVEFMGTGIDAAWGAKQRLLFTAFYCFGDDEFFSEVSDLTPERRKALEKLGFSIEGEPEDGELRFTVKGKKAALRMDRFISQRSSVNRLDDSKLGIGMLQSLGQVIQNPLIFQSLGVAQVIRLFNYVWRMIGLPEDFELKPTKIDPAAPMEQQQQEMMKVMEQAKEAIVQNAVQIADQNVKKNVVDPLSQELAKMAKALQELMENLKQVAQMSAENRQVAEQTVQAVGEVKQENDAQSQAIVKINEAVQQLEQIIAAAAQPQVNIATGPTMPAGYAGPGGPTGPVV